MNVFSHILLCVSLILSLISSAQVKTSGAGNNDEIEIIINNKVVESIQLSLDAYDSSDFLNITTYDIDALIKSWEKYNSKEPLVDEVELTEGRTLTQSDSIKEDVKPFVSSSTLHYSKQNEIKTSSVNKEYSNEVLLGNSTNIDYQNLKYRVQIAASKVPLDSDYLQKIYTGTRQVKEFTEEGWHKYYIAETTTLKEALIIRKESAVHDAFVMAYMNGVKVTYYLRYSGKKAESKVVDYEYKTTNMPLNNSINDLAELSKNKIVIVVQISAETKEVSIDKLREKYNGNEQINYIYEDGWHKYSFGNYSKFWPANYARRDCGISDAFVVAYKNGKKYDLWANNNNE